MSFIVLVRQFFAHLVSPKQSLVRSFLQKGYLFVCGHRIHHQVQRLAVERSNPVALFVEVVLDSSQLNFELGHFRGESFLVCLKHRDNLVLLLDRKIAPVKLGLDVLQFVGAV